MAAAMASSSAARASVSSPRSDRCALTRAASARAQLRTDASSEIYAESPSKAAASDREYRWSMQEMFSNMLRAFMRTVCRKLHKNASQRERPPPPRPSADNAGGAGSSACQAKSSVVFSHPATCSASASSARSSCTKALMVRTAACTFCVKGLNSPGPTRSIA